MKNKTKRYKSVDELVKKTCSKKVQRKIKHLENDASRYPYITKLGIEIYKKPYSHIISEDLDKVLTEIERKRFDKYFGVQTCLLRDDGKVGIYPYDAEAVFVRMFEKGKLTGTQLFPD